MRGINRFLEYTHRVLIHANRFDASRQRAFIEDTNNDLLAMDSRQNGNTEIDLLARHTDPETTILRQTALRDIESGENFDTRRDRHLECLRRRGRFDQISIDTISQL